ncbi:hypothetical protein BT93_L0535 [Corymbia citriodora subsp. variegata]|uniref:GIR1-like zinc ribbon domain-containing protein n=1 Tax=Corymbia citriodora subsp. variegata TaxID=360336 RepID=A0A8T0CX13_CORYI|nr:hypothetical protein BT93_L0535 [Corymbia citriodora subsp. variegata]
MEDNPRSSAVVPPTMFNACRRRFAGSTSRESINVGDLPNNCMGFSRRAIHGTLDLNQPISATTWILLGDQLQVPRLREDTAVHKANDAFSPSMTGSGQLFEDTKKRGFAELGENEKSVGLDSTLRLSTPEEGDEADQVSPQLGSSSGMHPNPKSKKVHADVGKPRGLSLILMGCKHCRMYVMASERDPTCPNCDRFDLLDQFRGDPSESMRKM